MLPKNVLAAALTFEAESFTTTYTISLGSKPLVKNYFEN